MQRKTRQQEAIKAAFSSAGRPLSPHEATTLAQSAVASLGIATVYRAIKDLVEARWLVPVATPTGTRFELASMDHHHHFFCRTCAKCFDIEACVGSLERLVPAGFVAEGHELTILGRCDACAAHADEVPQRT
jgi:Fur family ferric uptake transcriptional regulator